jgi:MoaA/NifB/PqqE/SkfB family radical SAM enzyme
MKYDVLADWKINTFCNFKCEYCISRNAPGQHSQQLGHNINKIIEGFNKSEYVWWIHMSGGEPFYQPNFIELCRGLENHYISINTNLSPENVCNFAEKVSPEKVAFIHCSLHIDERERLNLTNDFVAKYNLLTKKGFPTYATQVMHPSLLERFDRIFDFFIKKGIIIRPKVFRGLYEQKCYPAGYTEEQITKIIEYSKLSEKLSDIYPKTQIDPILDRYFIRGDLSFKGSRCKAGRDFVVITYDGDIIRCHGEPFKLGNIFDGVIGLLKDSRQCSSEYCPCPYYGLRFAESRTIIGGNERINHIDS